MPLTSHELPAVPDQLNELALTIEVRGANRAALHVALHEIQRDLLMGESKSICDDFESTDLDPHTTYRWHLVGDEVDHYGIYRGTDLLPWKFTDRTAAEKYAEKLRAIYKAVFYALRTTNTNIQLPDYKLEVVKLPSAWFNSSNESLKVVQ